MGEKIPSEDPEWLTPSEDQPGGLRVENKVAWPEIRVAWSNEKMKWPDKWVRIMILHFYTASHHRISPSSQKKYHHSRSCIHVFRPPPRSVLPHAQGRSFFDTSWISHEPIKSERLWWYVWSKLQDCSGPNMHGRWKLRGWWIFRWNSAGPLGERERSWDDDSAWQRTVVPRIKFQLFVDYCGMHHHHQPQANKPSSISFLIIILYLFLSLSPSRASTA